jgi:hypothetical protein
VKNLSQAIPDIHFAPMTVKKFNTLVKTKSEVVIDGSTLRVPASARASNDGASQYIRQLFPIAGDDK